MLKKLIQKLMEHKDLTSEETEYALRQILLDTPGEQIAAFLVLLHSKGETPEELYGLIKALRADMKSIIIEVPVLDIVGTGGDHTNTVNISTAASLLAAACGAYVVKHGNRSVSSQCGSADLLESFGVQLDKTIEEIKADLMQHHFAFCFAPNFHPSLKKIKDVRKQLGVRTTFNLLGPLLNPANAQHLLLGVYSPKYLELLSDTLLTLEIKHAMVIHSCGLDELSLLGPSEIVEIRKGKKERKILDPKIYGFEYCRLENIQGGEAKINKALIEEALSGIPGPIADTIVLNAGVGLYIADKVTSIEEGIGIVKKEIQTGNALKAVN